MKVEEALTKVFGFKVDHPMGWNGMESKWGPMLHEPKTIVETGYMQTYSGDRKLLQSNIDSEVLYLDHFGVMGVMGFKMRNKQWALFTLNLLGHTNTLIRVRDTKLIDTYKKYKIMFEAGSLHNKSNEDLDIWLLMKTIGGKRL